MGGIAPIARLTDVTKVYGTGHQGVRWRAALPFVPERARRPRAALSSISFEVGRGETVALIGPNGAGKSTALKLVAGVTAATSGTVTVDGTVGSMIELGIGFHPDLTGWENAWSSLVMGGYRRAEAADALGPIAAFAGIEDAMDRPLGHYSLGMRARLAFAVATHAPVDLLVVDEVLAVGDRDFQLRCLERIASMVAAGSGLLFVSHEMPLVTQVCRRALHVSDGRVVDDGAAADVVERYLSKSSRNLRVSSAPTAKIVRLDAPDEVAAQQGIRITMDVDVTAALADAKVGVDFVLPAVEPDQVAASSLVSVPQLAAPGHYRLDGISSPIGFSNAHLRMTTTVVDGVTIADLVTYDVHLGGDRRSTRPEVAVTPVFRIEHDPSAATASGRRAIGQTVADPIVTVTGATKRFSSRRRRTWLRESLPGRFGQGRVGDVTALDDVTLDVGRGEAVGLIGANGSGKSTLLRAIAGLHRLDAGRIRLSGRPAVMLDVAAGFHPEMTGTENARHVGAMVGMTADEIDERLPWVIEFAGLADVIDSPVRQYSSGMLARLGFAISLAPRSDLLLIDELLAVGDEAFRRAALDEVTRRVADGAAAIFVSHELRLVEQLCQRTVLLEHGRVVDDGPTSDVIDRYGGASWAGGVRDATSGIRLTSLSVRQRHIPIGGRLDISGSVTVDTPSSTARLEVSYRSTLSERMESMTADDRERLSILRRTIEPSGHSLTRPGRHDFEITIDENQFAGAIDLVVSVVDDRDETIAAEAWQEVIVGSERPEGFPGPVLAFEWTVTPRPTPSGRAGDEADGHGTVVG